MDDPSVCFAYLNDTDLSGAELSSGINVRAECNAKHDRDIMLALKITVSGTRSLV